MKAMVLNSYGPDSVFEMAEVETPKIKPGHVLVKIAASSVNTADTKIRRGGEKADISPKFPAILGMDFAGTVEEVGEGVANFSVGDEVYGCAGGLLDLQGTLAEYIVADAKLVALKPKKLSMREAAALPLVSITAYEGITRAGVCSGQKVLVHGGTGGVGHVALQLAKHFGADVFATGNGEEKLEIISKMGATPIDYKEESVDDYVVKHTDGKGFDVVFDTIGAINLLNSFQAAALNGQISTTVSMCEISLSQMHNKGLTLNVVFMLIPMIHNLNREKHSKILSEIAKIVDYGDLVPLLDEHRFSLNEAGLAHAYLGSGNAIGKVVIEN